MFEKEFIELTNFQKEYNKLKYIIQQLSEYAYLNLAYSNEYLRNIDDIDDELKKIIIAHYKSKLDNIRKEIYKYKIVKE